VDAVSKVESSSALTQPSGTGRFRRVANSLGGVSHRHGIVVEAYVLCLCLVDLGDQLLGQFLAVDLHRIAVAGASCYGDIRQRLSRFISLTCQPRDYSCGRIVLVEGSAELLSRLRQLLLERVRLEDEGVPLVLEGIEERRYRREVRRARRDDLRRLELDQVLDGQVLARDGVGVVLGDVCLDQALLENVAALARGDGLPRSFSRDGAEHGGVVSVLGVRRVDEAHREVLRNFLALGPFSLAPAFT